MYKIRVRKGIAIKTVTVDTIASCNGHAVAQVVNKDCKIDYYTRDSGQLFWMHKNARAQHNNYIKVIRRFI